MRFVRSEPRDRQFASADELRADALRDFPPLSACSRREMTRLRGMSSDGMRLSIDLAVRTWWAVRMTAVNEELAKRGHGIPRTDAGRRHQGLKRQLFRAGSVNVSGVCVSPVGAFTGRFWR